LIRDQPFNPDNTSLISYFRLSVSHQADYSAGFSFYSPEQRLQAFDTKLLINSVCFSTLVFSFAIRVEAGHHAAFMVSEQIASFRQKKSLPVLQQIQRQLEVLEDQSPPQGLLGKAVRYAVGQWDRLTRYVENGILHPDNNLAENAIRAFVVGRKGWLFAATLSGAYASAALHSVVKTVKANGSFRFTYSRPRRSCPRRSSC
jgi:hypothetical protein